MVVSKTVYRERTKRKKKTKKLKLMNEEEIEKNMKLLRISRAKEKKKLGWGNVKRKSYERINKEEIIISKMDKRRKKN